ncbi:MAG: HAMP domain-containing histidine kinase [Alphaproteobacteria bacterium]|nr:HAMP domain-containing histidine kinase [Alphaproteobacteria bacterium]
MIAIFNGMFSKVLAKAKKTAVDLERHLTVFGFFLIIAYPTFYFINSLFASPNGYESLSLRLIIGFLGLSLVMRNKWPTTLQSFLPLVLYVTLIISLPFFFFFMLFHNPDSNIWQINALVGLVLLSLFVKWKESLFLSILGCFLAWLAFSFTVPNPALPSNFWQLVIVYVSPLVYITLFFNKNEHIQEEKLASMKMLGGAIAHEMRTPLSAISMIGSALKNSVDELFEASDNNQPVKPDPYLLSVPESIHATTKSAFTIIDMILMNLKDVSDLEAKDVLSVADCVKDAIKNYPLAEPEQALIHFDLANNFEFKGDKTLFKHVIFNLLKNALYYVLAAGKGGIYITLESGPRENRLIFKDTGLGMPASMVPYVFDRFYSKTQHGTGIGLAFCKSAMQRFKGNITCKAIEGEHTTFILSFPVIDKTPSNPR